MFKIGDRVRLREDVTKAVLDKWISSLLTYDINHGKVYTVEEDEDELMPGTIALIGSDFLWPLDIFEKVESELLGDYYGADLSTVINDLEINTFFDDVLIYEVKQEDDNVIIIYAEYVNRPLDRERREYSIKTPNHAQGKREILEYAFNNFLIFLAKEWEESNK